jgi:hypothetical protein
VPGYRRLLAEALTLFPGNQTFGALAGRYRVSAHADGGGMDNIPVAPADRDNPEDSSPTRPKKSA